LTRLKNQLRSRFQRLESQVTATLTQTEKKRKKKFRTAAMTRSPSAMPRKLKNKIRLMYGAGSLTEVVAKLCKTSMMASGLEGSAIEACTTTNIDKISKEDSQRRLAAHGMAGYLTDLTLKSGGATQSFPRRSNSASSYA
jgi:hypothetical protein